MVKHNEMMFPIIPPKYDIGFVVNNCNLNLLKELEPWCSTLYVDCDYDEYVKEEQKNTDFDLSDRIKPYDTEKNNEILVSFDCNELNANNFQVLVNLSEILEDSGEEGHMKYEIFTFHINSLNTYEKDLILVK